MSWKLPYTGSLAAFFSRYRFVPWGGAAERGTVQGTLARRRDGWYSGTVSGTDGMARVGGKRVVRRLGGTVVRVGGTVVRVGGTMVGGAVEGGEWLAVVRLLVRWVAMGG